MKKLIVPIIAAILIITGAIMAVVGFSMGGAFASFYFDKNGINFIDNRDEMYEELSAFNSIECQSGYINIEITKGEKFAIKTYGMADYTIDNGKLIIKNKLTIGFTDFNIGVHQSGKIIIYVPQNIELNRVYFNNFYSKIDIKDVNIKDVEIDSDYGEIKLNTTFASDNINFYLRLHEGKIWLDGERKDDVYSANSNTENRINVKLEDGKIEIYTNK